MGLKTDIEEVVNAWQKAPIFLKLWLALSAFLAFSSIASLSDIIIKWKGFFLDAIVFYNNWIHEPMRVAFSWIGFHTSSQMSHLLVIFIVLAANLIRTLTIGEAWNNKKEFFEWFIWIPFPLILGLLGFAYLVNGEVSATFSTGTWICVALVLSYPIIFRPEHWKFYYFQIFVIVFLIGIFGAINSGIQGSY